MSRIAEMATSAVTNREKGGQIKRDGKEHMDISYPNQRETNQIWISLNVRLLH